MDNDKIKVKEVKIKGLSRPDIKTLDEALKAAAVEIWKTHPKNKGAKK